MKYIVEGDLEVLEYALKKKGIKYKKRQMTVIDAEVNARDMIWILGTISRLVKVFAAREVVPVEWGNKDVRWR